MPELLESQSFNEDLPRDQKDVVVANTKHCVLNS